MTALKSLFLNVFIISAITVGILCDEKSRNVTVSYNDGCDIPECRSSNGSAYYNLVHFQAKGRVDIIHHVWSSIGSPSLLVVRTTTSAKMTVDWRKAVARRADAITFGHAKDVFSVSAFVISRLLEYDDEKDTADITKVNVTRTVDVSDLMWSNVTINSTENSAVFQTVPGSQPAVNGSLVLKVQSLGVEGRSKDLPHLQHLPNTTEFSLVLDNLDQTYNKSRYALEMLIVRDQPKPQDSGIALKAISSIDDEYTPAVFKTYQVVLNKTSQQEKGSFMQWKPIVYTNSDRNTEDSKPVKTYSMNATNHYFSSYSLAHAYFGNMSALEKLDLGSFNVSFGIGKDGFYNATRYYVWNSVVGYGTPPTDGLSILIISIISVGLGLPVILIVFGGVVVACQKRLALRRANSLTNYAPING